MNTKPSFSWPKQAKYLGKRTKVIFNYRPPEYMGTIVRDDLESPYVTVIRLDDGRHVLATECQYAPVPDEG